jgi:hypothetical protein
MSLTGLRSVCVCVCARARACVCVCVCVCGRKRLQLYLGVCLDLLGKGKRNLDQESQSLGRGSNPKQKCCYSTTAVGLVMCAVKNVTFLVAGDSIPPRR